MCLFGQGDTKVDMIGVQAIRWQDDRLHLLDQRILPHTEVWLAYDCASGTAQAITDMVVRGAPAIGITAAYGVVLGARKAFHGVANAWKEVLEKDIQILAASRPTAVNLFWALDRMREVIRDLPDDQNPEPALLATAVRIHEDDLQANRAMGELGADLILKDLTGQTSVMTHCNTGALATGGLGTALGVIRTLHKRHRLEMVFADETRPWMQGSRLTAWELQKDQIPVTLNCDSAAAHIMKTKAVSWVIVGADRITANGDVANKIGTYSLAVLAKYHGVKFMVVAPTSTVDMALASGDLIPIEERTAAELKSVGGVALAPEAVSAFNPVFDVTPGALIDAIVTEKGVILNPSTETMAEVLGALS